MGKIVIGDKTWNVSGIPKDMVFTISSKFSKHIAHEIIDEIVRKDLAKIVVFGYELIESRDVPESLEVEEIKYDIFRKDEIHDKETCKIYLRQTRRWWEEHYSDNEFRWMSDFIFCITEIEASIGSEWFKMFRMVRGNLPIDFPASIRFATMIDNVWYWKKEKKANKIIKQYFEDNNDKIDVVLNGYIPESMIIDDELNLTFDKYAYSAKWLKDRM